MNIRHRNGTGTRCEAEMQQKKPIIINHADKQTDTSITKHEEEQTDTTVLPLSSPVKVPLDDHRFDGFDVALFSSTEEYTDPMACEVVGQIPHWLRGSFIRVGPGKFEWGDSVAGHLFDGDGIAHKFDIEDEKGVMYSNRFLETGK